MSSSPGTEFDHLFEESPPNTTSYNNIMDINTGYNLPSKCRRPLQLFLPTRPVQPVQNNVYETSYPELHLSEVTTPVSTYVPSEYVESVYSEPTTKNSRETKTRGKTRAAATFITPSGHKRGPLNGGCHFKSTRPEPVIIHDFRLGVYGGAPATVIGQEKTINSVGKAVIYNVYNTIADQFPGFVSSMGHGFAYDRRGRLRENVLFDKDSFAVFIKNHPLGRSLWFRIEKFPANCKGFSQFTQDHYDYNRCRAKECFGKKAKRGFHDGTIRIAIEEVLGRLPKSERFKNNPYFCAGYMHVECFERMIDIGQLIRSGMLRPRSREYHPFDPNTSKTEPMLLCPPAKMVTCLEEMAKRVIQFRWEGYRHNQADYLQTYIWLSVHKKGKPSFHDTPSDMSKEDAEELIRRRPVDPNWGGGRHPRVPVKEVRKVEAAGKKDYLVGPGTGRDSVKAKQMAEKIQEIVAVPSDESAYEAGEEWLRDCYTIPLANPELYEDNIYNRRDNIPREETVESPPNKKRKAVPPVEKPNLQLENSFMNNYPDFSTNLEMNQTDPSAHLNAAHMSEPSYAGFTNNMDYFNVPINPAEYPFLPNFDASTILNPSTNSWADFNSPSSQELEILDFPMDNLWSEPVIRYGNYEALNVAPIPEAKNDDRTFWNAGQQNLLDSIDPRILMMPSSTDDSM
ncbi:hypothetical protein FPQ18DRAFT_408149 [Pyronema domesticum]|nr:hypothetical protein FPQ18DRAFT_408149 [Pyronema domesticum]